MLKPLEQWYCDVCGEVIERPRDGYVLWKQDDKLQVYDFTIIHKGKCDQKNYPCSMDVETFLGAEGFVYLTAFLSLGPIKVAAGSKWAKAFDMDEFVDFMRRMQTPYYEDARRLYDSEEMSERLGDANEVLPYLPEYCEKFAREADAETA